MRLIDADALLEQEQATVFTVGGRGCGKTLLTACRNYFHTLVSNAPTIDAVPVVRCAECKYWLFVEDGFGDCTNRRFHLDGCADPSMKMDDFCSCGKRRGE